jgi:TRAP-type C4-dicarboxylate transport system substrate-binding protein
MVNINLDAWNQLPAEMQRKVLEIAAQMEDEMWNLAGDMDRKSREALSANGMQVSQVSSGFRAELDEIGEELRAEWAKKAGTDAQGILDEYARLTGRQK